MEGGASQDPDRTRPARHRGGGGETVTAPEDDGRRRAPSAPILPSDALPERSRERYQVVAEHGRGGIGRVLRAEDRELGRTVAIKELLRHDPVAEARFVREARLTARLEHPSIVPVHEAGRWPDGTPFYAMKLVAGRPLRDLIDEAAGVEERLALVPHVVAVADALAFAHARRIVHRDLKPANVIAGEYGETVVIDWGLARDLTVAELAPGASTAIGASHLTATGAVMGTPAFMAPEQLRGEPGDERTDVYALGALLYTVLTGRPPRGTTSVSTASSRGTGADGEAAPPPPPLPDDVPADLAAIALAAMAGDPAARLASAQAFADELRRFLRGHLVRSRRYTAAERALRWMRRHRELTLALAGAAIAVVAISAIAVARVVDERDRTDAQRRRAEAALADAERQREEMILTHARTTATTDPTTALAWLRAYRGPDRDKAQELAAVAIASGAATFDRRAPAGMRITEAAALAFDPPVVVALGGDGTLRRWPTTGDAVTVATSVDRVGIAASRRRGEVVFRSGDSLIAVDAADRRRTLVALTGPSAAMAFDEDGEHVGVAGSAGEVTVVALAGGVQRLPRLPAGAMQLALGPGARAIAVCDRNARLWLWRGAAPWREVAPCTPHSEHLMAFSTGGAFLVSVDDRAVHVVDTTSARRLTPLTARATVGELRLAGDDLLVGDLQGGVGAARLGRDSVLTPLLAGGAAVSELATAGDTVVVGRTDGAVELASRRTGDVHRLGGWTQIIGNVQIASDGCCALIFDAGRVQIVPLPRGRALPTDARASYQATYAADGSWLVADSQRGDLLVLERGGADLRHLPGHTEPACGLGLVGDTLLSASWDHSVRAWSSPWTAPRTIGRHESEVLYLVTDRRGGAYSVERSGRVHRLDVATGEAPVLLASKHPPAHLAVSPDGAQLALIGSDGHLERIDVASGRVHDERIHDGGGRRVAYLPGHPLLVTTGHDGMVALRRRDGSVVTSLRAGGRCTALAVSSSDEIAAVCDATTLVRIRRDGEHWVASHRSLDRAIYSISYSGDGRMLTIGLTDGMLYVVDTETGALAARRIGGGAVTSATFAPDQRELAVTTFAPVLHVVGSDLLELVPAGPPAPWFESRHDSDRIVSTPRPTLPSR